MTRAAGEDAGQVPHGEPRFAPGFLACLPLFALYEIGLAFGASRAGRNSAEEMLVLITRPLGEVAVFVRWAAILTVALFAWRRVAWFADEADSDEAQPTLGHTFGRPVVEGVLFAVLLGPLLLWMLTFFDEAEFTWAAPRTTLSGAPVDAPDLALACRLVGAAPWEELFFRVGAYGIVFLLVRRILAFLGVGRPGAAFGGELAALIGSSVFFAAFHLDALHRLYGGSGEDFDAGTFLWRLLAGLVLAGLFRWRGLGVVAWTHGLFNLGLALGASPAVFLGG